MLLWEWTIFLATRLTWIVPQSQLIFIACVVCTYCAQAKHQYLILRPNCDSWDMPQLANMVTLNNWQIGLKELYGGNTHKLEDLLYHHFFRFSWSWGTVHCGVWNMHKWVLTCSNMHEDMLRLRRRHYLWCLVCVTWSFCNDKSMHLLMWMITIYIIPNYVEKWFWLTNFQYMCDWLYEI